MNLFFTILLITFFFLRYNSYLFVIARSFGHHDQGTNNDRLALLTIRSQIISHDPEGVLSSWNESLPFCQWQGVTCGARLHQRRRVVALSLVNTNLAGTLSPFVGNLSFLHHLDLSNNNLQGQIPSQIGRLVRLRTLALFNNSFEGEIPANLSCCLNLERLSLSTNHLIGVVPPEFSLLTNLVGLAIHDNTLTGNLLNIVANMTSLQRLNAYNNAFQGTIPLSFYNLSSLQIIDLSDNRLEGSLPIDIGFHFPQLAEITIGGNFFQGNVPLSLSNLTQLQYLEIYSNNFTGKFRFTATNMPNLKSIYITDNYLGSREADDLNFVHTLANCSQLRAIGCGFNNFGGTLPEIWSLELTGIDFQHNHITGNIPFGFSNLVNLEILLLTRNHLTGYLPLQIGQLTMLELFDCSDNNLMGAIPYSLGNLSRLSKLGLNNNNFEGMIPSSLGDCTSLLYLNLSLNNLAGYVPPHLFHASMLVWLDLSQNHLQGIIPAEIGPLRNLMFLDISSNAFSGKISSSLGSCLGLTYLYVEQNFFNGFIPQSFKSLTSLQYLYISHNKLSGQIPNFLSTFSLLELDLSFNEFEGEVPIKGVFANSSAMSVLGNSKLCGGIPQLHLPRCVVGTPAKEFEMRRKLSFKMTMIIGVACLIVAISMVSTIYLLFCRRKKNRLPQGSSMSEHFPKVSYDMILKATNGFSYGNLVGRGHFSYVYKGVLQPEGMVVAIKVIGFEEHGASKSFMAECNVLRNIRHRNILKIVTACSSTDFKGNDFQALVYEFMSNGNLQQWIHVDRAMDGHNNHQQTLSLLQRLNIAIDMACALDYLHNNCDVPIIHCDLKPSNILLNDDMVAHVGDFGLARFRSHATTNNSSSIALKGTVGYAAPEYGLGSLASKQGDMYNYGMVLIEMMTAKKPTETLFEGSLNLHQYAKSALPNHLTKIIDPTLLDDHVGSTTGCQYENLSRDDRKYECMKAVIEIAVICSVESPQDRMSIKDALKGLLSTRNNFVRARHGHHSSILRGSYT